MTTTSPTITTRSVGHRIALCWLVPVALLVAACSSDGTAANTSGDPVADEAGEVSWLFSQTADSGRLELTDGEITRLVMNGIDAHTIMFSDQPDRLTNVVGTAAFTEQWDVMFESSAPNAVLVEHGVRRGLARNPEFRTAHSTPHR